MSVKEITPVYIVLSDSPHEYRYKYTGECSLKTGDEVVMSQQGLHKTAVLAATWDDKGEGFIFVCTYLDKLEKLLQEMKVPYLRVTTEEYPANKTYINLILRRTELKFEDGKLCVN